MIYGNWVAIHKGFTKHLPVDRPYSKIEAMYSLSVDADNKNGVSISGYSKLWTWSRNKVVKFLDDMGVIIEYPEDVGKKQNQKGQIKGQIRDRSDEKKGQPRFIIDAALYGQKDRSDEKKGQIRDRSKDTTIDPIINPNPKKTYSEDSIEYKLSMYLVNHIRKNLPEFKTPNLQSWSKDFGVIIRNDSNDIELLKTLIKYIQTEPFYIPNVLCPSKFHKRFNEIKLRHQQQSLNGNKKGTKNPEFF